MTVENVCVRDVDLAEPGEPVRFAAERMNTRKVGTLVVLNEQREPVGIVTDRDLAIRVLAWGRDPLDTTVGDVMTPCPATVREDTTIEAALEVMRGGPFRRLPVVDVGGKLVGMLSLDDLLRYLAVEFGRVSELLDQESPSSLGSA